MQPSPILSRWRPGTFGHSAPLSFSCPSSWPFGSLRISEATSTPYRRLQRRPTTPTSFWTHYPFSSLRQMREEPKGHRPPKDKAREPKAALPNLALQRVTRKAQLSPAPPKVARAALPNLAPRTKKKKAEFSERTLGCPRPWRGLRFRNGLMHSRRRNASNSKVSSTDS